MMFLTLTLITSTMAKISCISRLEMVCKICYACAPPAIGVIRIVEKYNTLITINSPSLGFVNQAASSMTDRSARENFF